MELLPHPAGPETRIMYRPHVFCEEVSNFLELGERGVNGDGFWGAFLRFEQAA